MNKGTGESNRAEGGHEKNDKIDVLIGINFEISSVVQVYFTPPFDFEPFEK